MFVRTWFSSKHRENQEVHETGRHRGMIANEHIRIGSNSYEKVKTIKYVASLVGDQNSVEHELICRLKRGN